MDDLLLYFAMKYEGDFRKMYVAITTKESIDNEILREYKKQVKHKYVTVMSHNYPEYFKSKNCPPIVLFYKGNLELIDKDLPKEYSTLENGKRFISTVIPIEQNGKFIFDYVVAAESQEDLEKMLEHLKSKGLPMKNYDKPKKKQMER